MTTPDPNQPRLDEIQAILTDAGTALAQDMWRPQDQAFLAYRAADLLRLGRKAAAARTARQRAAYLAAAADSLQHLELLALMRAEVASSRALEVLRRAFWERVIPALVATLPGLLGLSGPEVGP